MHFRKMNFFHNIYPNVMCVLVGMKTLFNVRWMVCKLKELLSSWTD